MIAELGATGAVFPADDETRAWLDEQERARGLHRAARPVTPGDFDEEEHIDLAELVPLVAKPSSPGNVVPVDELVGTPLQQVCVGSSVNSSYDDLALVRRGDARPAGSRRSWFPRRRRRDRGRSSTRSRAPGPYVDLLMAGVRMLEPACGPCVGMGQAPPSGANSLRTFNRNFPGRSGTTDDQVYLCSPAIAAVSMLNGVIADPRELTRPSCRSGLWLGPRSSRSTSSSPSRTRRRSSIQVPRGPNIFPPPEQKPLPDVLDGRVLIVAPDDISTGDLSPDGATVMAYRSNVPAIAEFTFQHRDQEFPSGRTSGAEASSSPATTTARARAGSMPRSLRPSSECAP